MYFVEKAARSFTSSSVREGFSANLRKKTLREWSAVEIVFVLASSKMEDAMT
jgi:hypothetical protein